MLIWGSVECEKYDVIVNFFVVNVNIVVLLLSVFIVFLKIVRVF